MIIEIDNLTEFGLVKLIDGLPFTVICLDIKGGQRYLVSNGIKQLKETESFGNYPCFKVSIDDTEAFNRALTYNGYTTVRKNLKKHLTF